MTPDGTLSPAASTPLCPVCQYDDRKRLVLRMALSQMSVNTCTGAERGLIAGLLADLAPAAGAGGGAAVTGSEEARP